MYHLTHFPTPLFDYADPHRTLAFVAKPGTTVGPHRPSQYSDPLFAPSNTVSMGELRPYSPSPDCCSSFWSYPRPTTHASQPSNRNEKAKTELHSIRPNQDTKHELQLNNTKLTTKLKRRTSVQCPVPGMRFAASSSQAHSHFRQSSDIPLLSTFPLESTDADSLFDQSEYEYEYDHKRQRDRAQRAWRRKKVDKLSRTFGERAPQDLIFPELTPTNFDIDIVHRHIDQNIPSSSIPSFAMTRDANVGNMFESQSQSDATHVLSSSLEHSFASTSAIGTSAPGARKTRNRTSVPPHFSSDESSSTVDFGAISSARTTHPKIDHTIPPLPSTPPPKSPMRPRRRSQTSSTLAPRYEDRRVSSNSSIAEQSKLSKHHEAEIEKTNVDETVSETSEIFGQGDIKDLRTWIELQIPVRAAPQISLTPPEVCQNSNDKQRSSASRTTKMQRRQARVRPSNSLNPPILVDGNGETYVRFDYFTAALMPAASPDSISSATRETKHKSEDLSPLPCSRGELLKMEALTRNEGKEARGMHTPSSSLQVPLSTKDIGSQVEHGRRRELEWSGEWNVGDIGEVVKALRELKA